MKIVVINGPNINFLGIREVGIYGKGTYQDLLDYIKEEAEKLQLEVCFYQSNHEGDLIDYIQQAYGRADGILINPAGYTHTSVAILDALKAVNLPTVEVHLSDVATREAYRQLSYVSEYALKTISGKGFLGYKEGLVFLTAYLGGHDETHL